MKQRTLIFEESPQVYKKAYKSGVNYIDNYIDQRIQELLELPTTPEIMNELRSLGVIFRSIDDDWGIDP